MESTQSKSGWVHGLMFFTVVLVAFSFPVGAAITHAMPSEVMMLLRFGLASALFAPYILLKHGCTLPSVKALLGYGLLSIPLVAFFYCMFESLRYTTALNTGALYTTVPAITAVFAYFINKSVITLQRSAGLLLGTIGSLLIVFRGDVNALLTFNVNQGDLIFLLGCLFMGSYNPLIKRLYNQEPMAVMTFWVILMGTCWLLLLSWGELAHVKWLQVDLSVYLGLGYLAIFTTLLSFFVLQFSTVKIGATKVAAYGFLTPIMVVILSILLGENQFDWQFIPGLLLVILALLLINIDFKVMFKTKGVALNSDS
jgi:drug/metabolite transporter (DMT)-like permease